MSIYSFFANRKFRVKLLFAFASLLLLTVGLVVTIFIALNRIRDYQKTSETIDEVNIHLLELQSAAKDFVNEGFKATEFHASGKSPLISRFNDKMDESKALIRMLSDTHNEDQRTLDSVSVRLEDIGNTFSALVRKYTLRGFRDFGLEGELRNAIHEVENMSLPYDRGAMLMLRRHEKDFFLRKDEKYVHEFNGAWDSFLRSIEALPEGAERSRMLSELTLYKLKFNEISRAEAAIGLDEQKGLRGHLGQLTRTRTLETV